MTHQSAIAARSHLVVALDLAERESILAMARTLRDQVDMVKLGLEAFVAHGPSIVEAIRGEGLEVFLDLKLHDIPRTVAAAARQASRLDVGLLTVHASGGPEMVRAAREALAARTALVAVTVLTSLGSQALADIGFCESPAQVAHGLGQLARQAGADGLVCSGHELRALAALGGLRVVPGIRGAHHQADDQRRVATAGSAVSAGATWVVVGRPITQAADPASAAAALVAEIQEAKAGQEGV